MLRLIVLMIFVIVSSEAIAQDADRVVDNSGPHPFKTEDGSSLRCPNHTIVVIRCEKGTFVGCEDFNGRGQCVNGMPMDIITKVVPTPAPALAPARVYQHPAVVTHYVFRRHHYYAREKHVKNIFDFLFHR